LNKKSLPRFFFFFQNIFQRGIDNNPGSTKHLYQITKNIFLKTTFFVLTKNLGYEKKNVILLANEFFTHGGEKG